MRPFADSRRGKPAENFKLLVTCTVQLYMSRELWYLLHTLDCRNAHSVMSMEWLRAISESGMPSLICLTFADRLFAEQMTKNKEYPHPEVVRTIISDHMQVGHLMQSIVQTIRPKSFTLCNCTSCRTLRGNSWNRLEYLHQSALCVV